MCDLLANETMDVCIAGLKLLRDDMEKERCRLSSPYEGEGIWIDGWNSCLDKFRELIDEMIGEE